MKPKTFFLSLRVCSKSEITAELHPFDILSHLRFSPQDTETKTAAIVFLGARRRFVQNSISSWIHGNAPAISQQDRSIHISPGPAGQIKSQTIHFILGPGTLQWA